MKRILLIIIIISVSLLSIQEARAFQFRPSTSSGLRSGLPLVALRLRSGLPLVGFWIWTPKTKKLVNPKYAVKDTPEEQFKWAMKFFKDKQYKEAAEEFSRLAVAFKDSDLAPEAQYYAGRSYDEAGKIYLAFQAYQKTVDTYPFTKRTNEIIKREYEIGKELYKKHRGKLMGKEIIADLDRAIEVFQRVKENAPFGEYGDQAQFMIGESYKKGELYNEAIKAFREVTDEHPQSKLVKKAKYEVAQCTYLASLKPDYDQELTDEAIEEFKDLAESKDGSPIAEEARNTVFLLEEKKAQNLFNTAKFYEGQKRYKSAAIYYREILKKYPESSFGKLAEAKMKKIEKFLKEG
ncbi:MAG: outer membrane protein assembly factor BamD [Candidatus Omnitrophica bacterium]|nr:outer membrane protein assembly factor BamD [Candidatus Omnitrophota bacterium]